MSTHIRPLNKLSVVYECELSAIKSKSCSSYAAKRERVQQMSGLAREWGKGTLALINFYQSTSLPHCSICTDAAWVQASFQSTYLRVCVSLFVLFNLNSQLTQKSQMRDRERDVAWLQFACSHSCQQCDSQKYHRHGKNIEKIQAEFRVTADSAWQTYCHKCEKNRKAGVGYHGRFYL